jgi:hypothetical protein
VTLVIIYLLFIVSIKDGFSRSFCASKHRTLIRKWRKRNFLRSRHNRRSSKLYRSSPVFETRTAKRIKVMIIQVRPFSTIPSGYNLAESVPPTNKICHRSRLAYCFISFILSCTASSLTMGLTVCQKVSTQLPTYANIAEDRKPQWFLWTLNIAYYPTLFELPWRWGQQGPPNRL